MKVKYTGTSDFQGFDAKDFAKAGVEGKKVLFARDEPTEVSDEVGQALTAKDGIFGDFSFEEVKDSEEQADNGEANRSDSQDAPEGEALTESSTPQTGTADTRGQKATKKASSASTR